MRSGAPLTFLFTDLAGSTALLDAVGADAFDAIRRRHFAVLRDAIDAHGGTEVKNLGDGLMIVFESPIDGVQAAIAMQRDTLRQGQGEAGEPLGLRVGVAVGPATLDDGDYFGVAVVVAKRLCDRAEPGSILASQLVSGLAAGSQLRFRDLGTLDLKGLADPVAAAEVLWEPASGEAVPLPPALLGGGRQPFIGREDELARLVASLDRARDGDPPVVTVTGEPGIGKTRLLGRFAQATQDAGATVLFGRCSEEALVPYQPLAEALRHYVTTCPLDELRSQLGRHGGELVRLVPDLADRVPGLAGGAVDEPEGERFRLFEAVRHLLGAAARSRPLVLVLDDVHWADRATLSLLTHVALAPERAPLLVVLAYRDADARDGGSLGEALAELHRERSVERVALAGLSRNELAAMVRRHAGQDVGDAFVSAVHAETDGNPFFAGEVLRHMSESAAAEAWREDGLRAGIPESVREVIGRRVAILGPDVDRVLCVAAVLGREFRPARLAAAPDLQGVDVPGALERAMASGLVEEAPGRPGRLRFGHALTRQTIYRGLPAPRRARLHRQVAEELEARVEAADGSHLPELAHHYFEAAALGGDDKAIEYAVRAGAWATRQVAYEEAAAHYRRALAALEQSEYPSDARRCELVLELGDALWRSGEIDAARAEFGRAAALAESLGDAERLGAAALGLVGPFNTAGAPDAHHVETVERALALLGPEPSPLRARLLGRLCDLLAYVADAERRTALGREAVEMARATGDHAALADVMHAVHISVWDPDDLESRLVATAEMARLVSETGATGLAGYGHTWRLASELERADRDAADRILAEQAAEAERLRRPSVVWQVAVHRGMVALLEGRLDEVEAAATEALSLAPVVANAIHIYGVQLMFLRREQGRLGEMLDMIRSYAEQAPEFVAWTCAYGWTSTEGGRLDEARRVLDDMLSDDLARVPRDNLYVCALMGLSDAAAALGDADAAEVLRHRLAPYAGQAALVAPVAVCHGAPARSLGNMHALAGDHDAADAAFEAALDINARLRAAPALGHTQVEYSAALLERGEEARAGALHAEASATAERLRLPGLASRCQALAVRSPGR